MRKKAMFGGEAPDGKDPTLPNRAWGTRKSTLSLISDAIMCGDA